MIVTTDALQIVSAPTLPDATLYPRGLVSVGGTLYWSDGTQWHQVAPASGGGAALEEPVVDYTYVVF